MAPSLSTSDTSDTDVSAIIAKLQSLTENTPKDEESRKKLLDIVRNLGFTLETAQDTIQRICYLPLQLTIARVANDLKLFDLLVEGNGAPRTVSELADKTGADPILLKRLLRFLASNYMVKELGEDEFTASTITKSLSTPALKAGISHNFDTMMPCYGSLPAFLKDTNYQNPSDGGKTAFQRAHATDLPAFVWLPSHPANFESAMQWMVGNRAGQKTWLDVFPIKQDLLSTSDPATPVFVDVGGGVGHQCAALVLKFPELGGRVILQDVPPVLQHAIPTQGVELMPHDFWTPQPVKGAKAYYMRNVLHDYPDDQCVKLLRLTAAAMDKDSVILIDEMMLPNKGINWHQGQIDIAMMSALASVERSRSQWESVLDSADLKINKFFTYVDELQDTVMVVTPK